MNFVYIVPIDYAKLASGEQISNYRYTLDDELVSRYVKAVSDKSELYSQESLVPPMSIAALSLRGVVVDLDIPGGTVHVGQELEFMEAVLVGDRLDCIATLLQNAIRKGWRFMVVKLEVNNREKRRVMEGKSTILIPV